MLKLKHNKKRNTGLITEFFSRHMSKSIVLKEDRQLEEAKKIWVKYFSSNKDSELFKEYSLFTTLYETNVKNKETAASLLRVVKEHSKKQNIQKLEQEKTALIQEINSKLNADKTFFECDVPDYKNIATIQILLNSWRENNLAEIAEVASLEDKLLEHLIAAPTSLSEALKEGQAPCVLESNDEDLDALVVSLMTEKFNRKYEKVLTEDQKNIINAYVFSQSDEVQRNKLAGLLNEQRRQTLSFIEYELNTNTVDARSKTKLTKVKDILSESKATDVNCMDDDMIMFYVNVCKLKDELKENNSNSPIVSEK